MLPRRSQVAEFRGGRERERERERRASSNNAGREEKGEFQEIARFQKRV